MQKSTGQSLRTGAVHSGESPPCRIVKIRECLSSCLPPVNDYGGSALQEQVGGSKISRAGSIIRDELEKCHNVSSGEANNASGDGV